MAFVGNETNLLILGAGQYSYVVEEIAKESEKFSSIHILDDNLSSSDSRVIGTFAELKKLRRQYRYAIVSIGNPTVRKKLITELLNLKFEIPILVHPRAWISSSAKIEMGCVLEAQTVVNANAKIGKACFVCAGAVINHNAEISDFCQIDCNATISARNIIPEGIKVAAGSVVDML